MAGRAGAHQRDVERADGEVQPGALGLGHHRAALRLDLAGQRRQLAEQHAEERRLAAAVGPEDRDALPGLGEVARGLAARGVPVLAAGPAAPFGRIGLPAEDGLHPLAEPIPLIQGFYPLAEALARLGLAGAPTDRVLRPFLAGVLADGELTTSRRYADLVVRSFVRGTPALPAAGMQALA